MKSSPMVYLSRFVSGDSIVNFLIKVSWFSDCWFSSITALCKLYADIMLALSFSSCVAIAEPFPKTSCGDKNFLYVSVAIFSSCSFDGSGFSYCGFSSFRRKSGSTPPYFLKRFIFFVKSVIIFVRLSLLSISLLYFEIVIKAIFSGNRGWVKCIGKYTKV